MQAHHIQAWCRDHGYDLLDLYSDPGLSGARWQRPGLQRLLSRLPRSRGAGLQPADALLVYRLDRLSRKPLHLHLILERLEKAGLAFVSTSEPEFDTTRAMGRALLGMAATFAALQREVTGENVADARALKAARGNWFGRPPLGYKSTGGILRPDHHAPAVRLAYRLYVRDRLPAYQVAKRISALVGRTIPTSKLTRLLSRPVYLGLIPHNGELYPGRHKPLVDKDTWDQAQRIIASRRRVGARSEGYLLSGILRCRHCSGPMAGHHSTSPALGREVGNYECSRSHTGGCRGSWLSVAKAHQILLNGIRDLSRRGADLGPITWAGPADDRSDEHRLLEADLSALAARRQRLLDLAGRAVISDADLKRGLAALDREGADRQATLAGISRSEPAIRPLRRLFRGLAELLESPDVPPQRKKDLLADLFSALVIHPDRTLRLTIHYPAASLSASTRDCTGVAETLRQLRLAS
jgi:DNA invertase Pin-like site-specific DNA recombinase